jgi:NADP-dependent 3-hydroxy acid dehydrogenase YdfG
MPARVALVTGASSGIGLAIAELLGETAHGLTVAARRPEKLADAVEQRSRRSSSSDPVSRSEKKDRNQALTSAFFLAVRLTTR